MDTTEKKSGFFRAIFDFSSLDQRQRKTFVFFALGLCALLAVVALIVFFAVLKGPEKVMVPDVRNMDLADGLVKLQERELYPRLTLRFTDNPQDKNIILEQSPEPGSIVKAGRRIRLTVSRGAVLDRIENYVGQDLASVEIKLQALSVSGRPLVSLRDPILYRFDAAAAGTILEQKPPAGEAISGPALLEVIVSKGPEQLSAAVPEFVGLSMAQALAALGKSPFVVDFAMRQAKEGEAAGKVAEQQPKAGVQAKTAERIKVVLTSPAAAQGVVSGIYLYTLPQYPYAVPVTLEAVSAEGKKTLIATLNHPGGSLSLPFSLPAGSGLVLSVLGKETARSEVKKP